MSIENLKHHTKNSSELGTNLLIKPNVKKFNWAKFKKYVETYDPEKHGGNNAETVFKDMLYGIGISVDEKYRFADGFKQFKQWLAVRLNGS